MDAHASLLLARELLHYRPVDDLYEDWLARITELVCAAGGAPLRSLSLLRPPSRAGGEDQEAPPDARPLHRMEGEAARGTAKGEPPAALTISVMRAN